MSDQLSEKKYMQMMYAEHIPVLTQGGNKDAEMEVPTIALTPPFERARITPIPEAAATTVPASRPPTIDYFNHNTRVQHEIG